MATAQRSWFVWLGTIAMAIVMGSLASVGAHAPMPTSVGGVPLLALGVLVCVGAAVPLIGRNWRLALWAFVVWLPFEDLFRKLAGNDIRIYLIKDVLFVVALVVLLSHLRAEKAWQRGFGSSRGATLLLLGWVGAMAVPALLVDWRVPVLGFRLNFLYLPLVAVGYFLASEAGRMRTALRGLTWVMAAALSLGIAQAFIGASFLNPEGGAAGLHQLNSERAIAGTGQTLFRPTGTFVDPGRFAAAATIGLALSLAYVALGRDKLGPRTSPAPLLAVAVSAAAVWVSGGKAALVVSVVLVAALLLQRSGSGGRAKKWMVSGGAAILVAVLLVGASYETAGLYYQTTLDPRSGRNEWSWRWAAYGESVRIGISRGGWTGRGTGMQSVGRQYLYGGEERSLAGLNEVEAGWGSVALEYGRIGLGIWLVWSAVWLWWLYRCVRRTASGGMRSAARVLFTWNALLLGVVFFTGYQAFQNYISNAFFWLTSGVIAGMASMRQEQDAAVPSVESAPHV